MHTQQLVLNTNGRGTDAASLGQRVQEAVAAVKVKPVVTYRPGAIIAPCGTRLDMAQKLVDGEAKPSFRLMAPLTKAEVMDYAKSHGISRSQAELRLKAARMEAAAPVVEAAVKVQQTLRKNADAVTNVTASNAKGNFRLGISVALPSAEAIAKRKARAFATHAADCIANGTAKQTKGGIIIPLLK